MNVRVLMTSGDEDTWEDVKDAITTEPGTVAIVSNDDTVVAIYAPGMWMKVEYAQ